MEILYYKNAKGVSPVKQFIDDSITEDKTRIAKTIHLLEKYGNELGRPYVAPIRDGINELRIKGRDNQIRILVFYIIGNCAVLTNGFIKKTEIVPIRELAKAKKYRKDFCNRRELK